jgi:membrane carboxypeptidase/penicillin-binding protein
VVKPFVVLEAIDDCGGRDPLTASSRILDEPLSIALPAGRWEPHNFDDQYLGPVLLREALAESRNVPAVRIARWCGFDDTAALFERAGLELPPSPPPSFVLGAVETSPLAVARAFTVFATPGRVLEPFPLARVSASDGSSIERWRPRATEVADRAAAYIVRDLLRSAVGGTAASGAIAGLDVAAKPARARAARRVVRRPAGSVVTVVWVEPDDGGRLGSPALRRQARCGGRSWPQRCRRPLYRWSGRTRGRALGPGEDRPAGAARPRRGATGTLPRG